MEQRRRTLAKPCLASGVGRASCKGRPARWGRTWCGATDCPGPRACRACRNAYMRAWRAARREKPGDRVKLNARAVVRMALRRGSMKRQPCEVCGAGRAQAHHDDYRQARKVRWLCPPHHRAAHRP